MSHERSQHDRPSAAHLAGSHIRQLKFVLVNTPSEAAVKLFHPTTEGALRERGTAWKAMHGALAVDGIWIYPQDLKPQCHNLDRSGQQRVDMF